MANKSNRSPVDYVNLRKRAERGLEERATADETSGGVDDVAALLHELEVHEIELETQNEELRTARHELELTLERFTELFDFAPLGYATLSPEGIVRELNLAGAKLLGRERARLIGTRFEDFVAGRDRASFSGLLERALSTDYQHAFELELRTAGNVVKHARLTATALGGDQPSVLFAFEDVSESRAKAAALERSERALREADLRKDEFLAVLSHELRNPLAPIRHAVFMLANAELTAEDTERAHAIIDRQVTHLTRLIDDLLDVTRIQRGKIQLQKDSVDLSDLVRRTVEDHRRSFEARGIELVTEVEAGDAWVCADSARLTQVLSNLLGNAEKFTERGGRVVVRLTAGAGRVVVSVRDTGIGIASSVLPHLFIPFAQAPQTIERSRGGLGLGLSMVKGLVELHDGKVTIHSQGPGCGTEVVVELPLDRQQAKSLTPRPASPARRLRVLIVEDNTDAADTLRDAISFLGHEVQVAYDGFSALECVRTFRPDAIVCDIGLPGMDGYALATAIRREPSFGTARLIALTGYARPEDHKRARAAGFDLHLAKPVDFAHLTRLLAEMSVASYSDERAN